MKTDTISEAELIAHDAEQAQLRAAHDLPDPWISIRDAAAIIPVHRSTMLRAVLRAERKGQIVTAKAPGHTGVRLVRRSDVERLYPALRRHASGRKPMTPEEARQLTGTTGPIPAPGTPKRQALIERAHHQ